MRTQFPDSFFVNPLSDSTEAVVEVPASKRLLPQIFQAAAVPREKSDFFLIAANMRPEEVHPDVVDVLTRIAGLLLPSRGSRP
jgi:hypothetical protein